MDLRIPRRRARVAFPVMPSPTTITPRPSANARSAFLRGAARVLDLGGALSPRAGKPSGSAADGAALRSDWAAVGNDLRSAMDRVASEDVEATASNDRR